MDPGHGAGRFKGRPSRPVLIVDNDVLSTRAVEAALREEGYSALSCREPVQAAELIRNHRPSLILLDLQFEASLPGLRHQVTAPIVVFGSADRVPAALQALKLGAYDFITKPIDYGKLMSVITSALRTEVDLTGSRRIGNYELRREIGRGGMGIVYEARDRMLDRLVAVKVLLPALAADPGFELRFLREARAAAKLSHPGLVTVFEAGRHRGRLFMAMELVHGKTLCALQQSGYPFTVMESMDIIARAAEAIEVAHVSGLIHRDIKPANLMLTAGEGVKVLDFGLVRFMLSDGPRLTEYGSAVGTPAYVAPEVIRGDHADTRSDIYSLGIVLLELLTRDDAFEADHMFTLLAHILEGRVKSTPASAPGPLQAFVGRMISVKPEDRPRTMGEVASSLRQIRQEL